MYGTWLNFTHHLYTITYYKQLWLLILVTSTHTLHHSKHAHYHKQCTEVPQFTGFLPNEAKT